MVRKAVATKEAVSDAVEELSRESLDPTVERVRVKLQGGSFSTISKILREVLGERRRDSNAQSDVPPDLLEIGQKAIQAIYTAVQRTASAKVEVIELEARRQTEIARHAQSEAVLEVERLEHESENAAQQLAVAQDEIQSARARAERAEGQLEALTREAQRTRDELEVLRLEAQRFRDEASKLQNLLNSERERFGEESARFAKRLALLQGQRKRT